METITSELTIKKTKDYFLFNQLKGNRSVNIINKNRLIKSFKKRYLVCPIIVNENFEIIDGQHRFEAAKELNLPIFYFVVPSYGVEEVQVLNSNQKNWSTDDYVEGYVDMGKTDYAIYRDFRNKYEFPVTQTMEILRDKKSGGTDTTNATIEFRNGDFKVRNINKSTKIFEDINSLKYIYEGYKRTSFVAAMITLLNKDEFSINEFLTKLSFQKTKLVDCTNVSNYIILIEQIYNFKRKQKLNLRF
tara:strand:- start:1033 stop:1770 length:738 start_codon:yes stop_codon:yes gene_type:complete